MYKLCGWYVLHCQHFSIHVHISISLVVVSPSVILKQSAWAEYVQHSLEMSLAAVFHPYYRER